ncbi:MAG: hypothetical protein JSW08_00690 [archaeon]|nr:MAG: hypothetical protein JSW08_00690 [archaeon]
MIKEGRLYDVFCFKGYKGPGTIEAANWEVEFTALAIPHLFTRVPKKFEDVLGIEGNERIQRHSGYCVQGVIFKPEYTERAKQLLAESGKKEGEDFMICRVTGGDTDLARIVRSWDAAYPIEVGEEEIQWAREKKAGLKTQPTSN